MPNTNETPDVLVTINEVCCTLKCVFSREVSEEALAGTQADYKLCRPGSSVNYGPNTDRGGIDKKILIIHYNPVLNYRDAVADLEALFDVLTVSWKRDIIGGTKISNVLAEVC